MPSRYHTTWLFFLLKNDGREPKSNFVLLKLNAEWLLMPNGQILDKKLVLGINLAKLKGQCLTRVKDVP